MRVNFSIIDGNILFHSTLSVLLLESFEGLHMETVIDIWVPFESWLLKGGVSPASAHDILLILHIIVRQSGELATLPAEVALIPTLV